MSEKEIINKVAQSPLITFNLASLGVPCGSPNATTQRCQQFGCYPKEAVARDFRGEHLNVTRWLEAAASFGGKYSVLNVGQWSGWLLWNSSSQNFSIANSVYGRDVFADYVGVSKRLNIKAGTFFTNFHNYYLGIAQGKVGGLQTDVRAARAGPSRLRQDHQHADQ